MKPEKTSKNNDGSVHDIAFSSLVSSSHFGDRITIQPQRGQGMSNIMFSSCLTISDAIAAAGKLKSMLRLTETETSQESQEHILHSAASILRHDIQSFVVNNEDYPNASEVSLAISVGKMPQSLLKFIC